MPYTIKKLGNGYKVCKKDGGKCFSKKPLTHQKAVSQLSAIELNTHNENISLMDTYVKEILK